MEVKCSDPLLRILFQKFNRQLYSGMCSKTYHAVTQKEEDDHRLMWKTVKMLLKENKECSENVL